MLPPVDIYGVEFLYLMRKPIDVADYGIPASCRPAAPVRIDKTTYTLK